MSAAAAASVELIELPAAAWHDRVSSVLAGGARFLALYADDGARPVRITVALRDGTHTIILRTRAIDAEIPSIVDLVPAAEWDEREAHDLAGVRFAGHTPLRPLVAHPPATADWTTPVIGEDVHQVAVGPIHAGIIESGHFRFHVVGERILHLDLRLFYNHRGLEDAAIGTAPETALLLAQRACAACAVSNTVAFAQAYETSLGGAPDTALRRTRTLLLELERLYNHLNDIGAVCAGIGFAPGAVAFAGLKERAQRINAALTGHRFLFGSVALGSSALAVDGRQAAEMRARIGEIGRDAATMWREIDRNGSVRDRLGGAGVLSFEDAERLGTCGPAGRASGVAHDVRAQSPLLWYPDFAAARPNDPAGDVAARVEMRARELAACCAILEELLHAPIAPGQIAVIGPATDLGIGVVESPRGQTVVLLEHDRGQVQRMHLRTGSYANWPSLAAATTDAILPDFPLINKSFELCYACADR
jgi:Ni,Fe-hydrogenase III large subunit